MIIMGLLTKKENQSYAWLDCPQGKFYIATASKYPVGMNVGVFDAEKFKPTTIAKNGVITIAVEAIINEAHFSPAIQPPAQTTLFTEVDEIEKVEEATEPPLSEPVEPVTTNDSLEQECEELGLSYPLNNEIVLDTTLSRDVLTKQSKLLKSQSYKFDVTTQIWTKEVQ